MGLLDDTAIFVAIIQQGGFSHAAKYLGLSNGLISRRISQLEKNLGVTLIKRTTRQFHLTPEGELFWQHAQRIQQELDSAVSLIQSSAKKPKGLIRVSAPPYFGRHYLTEMLVKFLNDFADIQIELILSNRQLDLIKEKLDLVIRGAGYLNDAKLHDSGMQSKLLIKEKIGLYAAPGYLYKHGEPVNSAELMSHNTINMDDAKFKCDDIESALIACVQGAGIGRFTDLNVRGALQQRQLQRVLTQEDFGEYHLYAIYPQQKSLPQRTRLLLEFIVSYMRSEI